MNAEEAFRELYDIVIRLRSPGGCPWDIEQTPLSLRSDLIEETYECVEAIDENDPAHVKEELGDIFLLATMLSYMHEQEGHFTVSDALKGVSQKLIRRHPHVFDTGENSGTSLTSGQVLQNWAAIKVEQEGRKPKDSILDEVRRGLPPLDRSYKLQKKAAKAGFDWPDVSGVLAKIKEELEEVESEIRATTNEPPVNNTADNGSLERLEEELGDLLFSVVNLCRFFDIAPSIALQRTNVKFTERFKYVEKRMKEEGQEMKAQNLDVMDQYWNEAKGKSTTSP